MSSKELLNNMTRTQIRTDLTAKFICIGTENLKANARHWVQQAKQSWSANAVCETWTTMWDRGECRAKKTQIHARRKMKSDTKTKGKQTTHHPKHQVHWCHPTTGCDKRWKETNEATLVLEDKTIKPQIVVLSSNTGPGNCIFPCKYVLQTETSIPIKSNARNDTILIQNSCTSERTRDSL